MTPMLAANAYAFPAYGAKNWRACIALLLDRGFTEIDVDAILRSVTMRLAADRKTGRGRATSADLARFLDESTTFDGLTLRAYVDAMIAALKTEPASPLRVVWRRP